MLRLVSRYCVSVMFREKYLNFSLPYVTKTFCWSAWPSKGVALIPDNGRIQRPPFFKKILYSKHSGGFSNNKYSNSSPSEIGKNFTPLPDLRRLRHLNLGLRKHVSRAIAGDAKL